MRVLLVGVDPTFQQYSYLYSRIQTKAIWAYPEVSVMSTSYKYEISRSIDRSAVFELPPLPSPPHHPPVDLVVSDT
jgi:hypothetical protein